MRNGLPPADAADKALKRVAKFYPNFMGAVVAVSISGEYGAACHGIPSGFPYSIMNPLMETVFIGKASCSY